MPWSHHHQVSVEAEDSTFGFTPLHFAARLTWNVFFLGGNVEVSQTWGWQHVSFLNGGEQIPKVSVVFGLGLVLHDLNTRFTHHEAGQDLASSFSHFSRRFACNGDAFWRSVVTNHQANCHVSVGWSEIIPAVVVVFQGKGFTPHWSNRRNFWRYHMVHFFVETGSWAT